MNVCIHMCAVSVHICVCAHVHMCVHTYVCVCTCVYYACICMCISVHVRMFDDGEGRWGRSEGAIRNGSGVVLGPGSRVLGPD